MPIGNLFEKVLYAVKFGEPNLVLSGSVHENSKILYDRNPRTMVEKVAPWLTVDSDPYPVVVDGRIKWVLDGYTVTDKFPLSQRESLETMTDDSLADDLGFQTLPTDEINYMRNSVKATVDAYDGEVTLYEWETDPISEAWGEVFPDILQPREDIPDELLEHLRYPDDLFKVQRYQFAKYHETDAKEWYDASTRWEVPTDPEAEAFLQPPYRLFLDDTWALTSVYVPRGRANLVSYVSVNSDATDTENYGKISVLELPERAHRRPRSGGQRAQLGRGRARGAAQLHPGRRRPGAGQPAHAAGRRRADVRPAALREALGHRVLVPDPAVRDGVLRRRDRHRYDAARGHRGRPGRLGVRRRPGPRPSPRTPTAVAARPPRSRSRPARSTTRSARCSPRRRPSSPPPTGPRPTATRWAGRG